MIRDTVGVGLGTGTVLELGSGLGLGLVELLDGEGLGVSVGDGVGVSVGVGVEVSDGEADGLVSAGLLLTNAAVSTVVFGGDEQVVLAARGAVAASAAGDRKVPQLRTVKPAAAHSATRFATSDLTTASSLRSVPSAVWYLAARGPHKNPGCGRLQRHASQSSERTHPRCCVLVRSCFAHPRRRRHISRLRSLRRRCQAMPRTATTKPQAAAIRAASSCVLMPPVLVA